MAFAKATPPLALHPDSERELCVNSGGPRKERVREFGTDFSHRRVQP